MWKDDRKGHPEERHGQSKRSFGTLKGSGDLTARTNALEMRRDSNIPEPSNTQKGEPDAERTHTLEVDRWSIMQAKPLVGNGMNASHQRTVATPKYISSILVNHTRSESTALALSSG